MKTEHCRKWGCSPKPQRPGTCVACGGRIVPEKPPRVHIETCSRCRHSFDTLAAGHAGISLVPADGWMSEDFRRVVLCPTCRDELRAWLRLPP